MKYFLGFLATIVLVVVVFILVIRGFTADRTPKDILVLADQSTSSLSVQYTVDGPVNSQQEHVGYRIIIDKNEAKIETYKGYQNEITSTKTYVNNTDAYGTFLRALDIAGFSKGVEPKDGKDSDERGVCADGNRSTYEIKNSNQGDKRYWTTTCGGGTFKGDDNEVAALFERQIPEFSRAVSELEL